MTRQQLAKRSSVGHRSIDAFEVEAPTPGAPILRLLQIALEEAGVCFALDDPDRPDGVWRGAVKAP